ncbi:sulfate transporter family protein [Salinarimonas soli]|uniref:Sulfate transporter family protein n=1 Tax=Salinarimonas soli TaxID=1638099 RepID=A0A5B2V3L8_9HYPH|nr:sulfate transporter family protein [Salinarimonas soli]KAA2233448.1 sulfate transporter family protein [Salinarimonas soli]
MLVQAAFAAWRQVFSAPFRGILWKSLALTVALLALLWFGLTRLLGYWLQGHPLSTSYPLVDTMAVFLAGAGLVVALAFVLPAVSSVVAGFFLDDAAEIVERTDFPGEAPGEPMPLAASLLMGLRFAGLSLLCNLAALALIFVPVVNVAAFFGVNAYLLGREYFELAAGRFRPTAQAAAMRRFHAGTAFLAGAMMAGLLLVPLANLLTPLFGIALMVHVHKRLTARDIARGIPQTAQPPLSRAGAGESIRRGPGG